jgi:AraC family transcriptional regulator, positive regulator of tynA and feaB
MPVQTRTWTTTDQPASMQFAYWREVICEAFAALEPRPIAKPHGRDQPGHPGGFPSSVQVMALGDMTAAHIRTQGHDVLRGFDQIRADPQDRLFVNLQLCGSAHVRQGAQESLIPAGSFFVVDTARPYEMHFEHDFELLSFRVPRERLMPLVRSPQRLLARAMDGRVGVARVACGYMHSLIEAGPNLSDASLSTLADQFCELVAASARDGEATNSGLAEAAAQALVQQARAWIAHHLANPALNAGSLAQRFGVSVRCVHKAFSATGRSVGETIRQMRLARCADDLRNPHDRRNVSTIAQRWGFRDGAHFSRAFAAAYGLPPMRYRQTQRDAGRQPTTAGN